MSAGSSPLSSSRNRSARIYWMDAVRAISVILVSVNHALNRSLLRNFTAMSLPGLRAYLTSFLYVSSRLAVPMFLMLSGALLLDRDYSSRETRSRFWRHNWFRLVLVTAIWLAIRFLLFGLLDGNFASQSLRRTVLDFLQNQLLLDRGSVGPLWYMAMILCLYPLIPLIATAVRQLPGKAFLLPGAIVLCFSILVPNALTVLEGLGVLRRIEPAVLPEYLFSYYLLYLVWGHYAAKGTLDRVSTALVAVGFAVSLLGTSLFQHWANGAANYYSVRYADLGVAAAAVFLFELLRRLATRPRCLGPAVRSLARCSLGIFFVHQIIMASLDRLFRQRLPGFTGLCCFAVLELAGLLGAWLFVWLTSRIPFVGKWLYLIPPKNK